MSAGMARPVRETITLEGERESILGLTAKTDVAGKWRRACSVARTNLDVLLDVMGPIHSRRYGKGIARIDEDAKTAFPLNQTFPFSVSFDSAADIPI